MYFFAVASIRRTVFVIVWLIRFEMRLKTCIWLWLVITINLIGLVFGEDTKRNIYNHEMYR